MPHIRAFLGVVEPMYVISFYCSLAARVMGLLFCLRYFFCLSFILEIVTNTEVKNVIVGQECHQTLF